MSKVELSAGVKNYVPPVESDSDRIMTIQEVASYMGCNFLTIRRLARRGEIPCFKLGSRWRFKKGVLDRWVEQEIKLTMENPLEEGE